MIFSLSRNAPCPCMSGKKYKLCCMGKISASQEEYYGLLRKGGIIKKKLLEWASENFGNNELDKYAFEFGKKSFEETVADQRKAVSFFDWFFLEAVYKGEKMLKAVADGFSNLFDDSELAIIREWLNNTQAGIFEVEKIDKDNWKVTLKEIFSGRRYEVKDRRASETAVRGDVIFARVQTVFSSCYLSGAVNFYERLLILDQLKDFIQQRFSGVRQRDPAISYEAFMNRNSRMLNDFSPKIKVTTEEGEEVKMCERAYRIDLNRIEEILDWFGNDKGFVVFEEVYRKNRFKSARITLVKQKENRRVADATEQKKLITFTDFVDKTGKMVRSSGSIEINGAELKLFTTSESALKGAVEKLEKGIGQCLKLKSEKIATVDEVLEAHSGEDREEEFGKEEKTEDDLKREKDIMERYYRDWCRQRIPALGNKTPKDAIKSQKGREALREILLDFENREEHEKREGRKYFPSVKVIREELGFYD